MKENYPVSQAEIRHGFEIGWGADATAAELRLSLVGAAANVLNCAPEDVALWKDIQRRIARAMQLKQQEEKIM